jgi:hypothetical protein
MSERHVKSFPENAWVIAKSDGCGISRDRTEVAERYGNRPGKTVDRFGVSERSVVGDDHHVAVERAVVMDVEISLCWSRESFAQGRRATRLRYAPTCIALFILKHSE